MHLLIASYFICRVILASQGEMDLLVLQVRKATQVLMVNLEMMATLGHMAPQEDQEDVSIDQVNREHLVKMDTQGKR